MTPTPDDVRAAIKNVMCEARGVEEQWATHWLLDAVKVCRFADDVLNPPDSVSDAIFAVREFGENLGNVNIQDRNEIVRWIVSLIGPNAKEAT